MAGGPATTVTQAEYWNGEVGARWARDQALLDAVFAPLTEALFAGAGLAAGEAVLDIGCGTGATTLEAARRVGPAGLVTGADISAPMLAVARTRASAEATGGSIRFVEADVERADLGAAAFDRAISRFGVMFFSDSRIAFANVRRMLRPGGRLTILCWRALSENPWFSLPHAAVLPLLPEPPAPAEPDTPGPFRFADADALCAMLRDLGFADVACEPVDRPVVLGRGADAAQAVAKAAHVVLGFGPTSRLVREADAALRARAEAAVTEVLRGHVVDGEVRLAAGCWLVRAG